MLQLACGVCLDGNVLANAPFLPLLFLVLAGWWIGAAVLRLTGPSTMPAETPWIVSRSTLRKWLFGGGTAFLVLAVVTEGSVLGTLGIVAAVWVLDLLQRIVKALRHAPEHATERRFRLLHLGALAACGLAVAYGVVLSHRVGHVIGIIESHGYGAFGPSSLRWIEAQGEDAVDPLIAAADRVRSGEESARDGRAWTLESLGRIGGDRATRYLEGVVAQVGTASETGGPRPWQRAALNAYSTCVGAEAAAARFPGFAAPGPVR